MAGAKRPVRVTVLTSTFPRWRDDAVPSFVLDYCKELIRRGHDVTVIAPHADGSQISDVVDGVPVQRFRYWLPARSQSIAYGQFRKTPWNVLKAGSLVVFQAIATARHSANADVVHAHWLIPQGFSACLAALVTRVPVVSTVHGGDIFTLTGMVNTLVKRWVLRRSQRVTVNSTVTLAATEKLTNKTIAVVPMGVTPPSHTRPRRRAEGSRLSLLFAGRLVDGKGIDDTLRALAIARRGGIDVTLTVAGEGPLRQFAERLTQELDISESVSFKGWVSRKDLGELYCGHDVFIGPSHKSEAGWEEAYGLVFAEAGLHARPVITTNCGGITDIVQDGITGWVCSQKNPEHLADAIQWFFQHPTESDEMGVRARDRALTHMTWGYVGTKYEEILKTTVRAPHQATEGAKARDGS